MAHPFKDSEIREIIWKQIEKDEKPGEHVGGSGHLGQVDCWIGGVDEPRRLAEGWEITYRYTISVTTEFAIYPDNPPQETVFEKTILIDDTGDIVGNRGSRFISSNWEPKELLDLKAPVEDVEGISEGLVQMVIDLETGRDITGKYIYQRLKELENIADGIIQHAVDDTKSEPGDSREIYETAHWEIHEKLGMGSIGPATSVAAGLRDEKEKELADTLGVKDEERIH